MHVEALRDVAGRGRTSITEIAKRTTASANESALEQEVLKLPDPRAVNAEGTSPKTSPETAAKLAWKTIGTKG